MFVGEIEFRVVGHSTHCATPDRYNRHSPPPRLPIRAKLRSS
jgi:hypothetical protein